MTMGALYFVFMMFGVFTIRVPREGWKPEGWSGTNKTSALISTHNVAVTEAWKTPQFVLLWIILFCNVTAGIGILEQASPMIQDFFKGHIGAVAAGGFVGLLSIFNMAGRFFWASMSDFLGRKATYFIFFTLGAVLFFFLPLTRGDHMNSVPLFVGIAAVIISHVRRRLRHHPGVPEGPVRRLQRLGDPRAAADRMVDGRHRRPADRQRHPGPLRRQPPESSRMPIR